MTSLEFPNRWRTLRRLYQELEWLLDQFGEHCRSEDHRMIIADQLKRFRERFSPESSVDLAVPVRMVVGPSPPPPPPLPPPDAGGGSSGSNAMNDLLQTMYAIMGQESSLIRLVDPNVRYHCFGDMHGSLSDLVYIRNRFWAPPKSLDGQHFVFLGDYVDRGIHGFEVAVYLMLARLLHPHHFTILRGNHEFPDMNECSFRPEMIIKFGPDDGHQLWIQMNECFSLLPYAAIICNKIFCCHGGIPRHLHSMAEIERIPKFQLELDERSNEFQLVWNDFFTADEQAQPQFYRTVRYFVRNYARGAGYMVGPIAVRDFLRKFRLRYVVRAHQYTCCEEDGYDCLEVESGPGTTGGSGVITLFSNSSYTGALNNTAYLYVNMAEKKIQVLPLVDKDTMADTFFNASELFETDVELVAKKFIDPFEEDDEQAPNRLVEPHVSLCNVVAAAVDPPMVRGRPSAASAAAVFADDPGDPTSLHSSSATDQPSMVGGGRAATSDDFLQQPPERATSVHRSVSSLHFSERRSARKRNPSPQRRRRSCNYRRRTRGGGHRMSRW